LAEHLKTLSETPEAADGYTLEEVTEARAELAEFIQGVKDGDIEADSEAIAEAKTIAEKLTERETALAVEAEARQAEIAALEEALGGPGDDDEEDEDSEGEEDSAPEVPEVEVPDTPAEIVEEETVTASVRPTTGKLAARIPAERRPRKETAGPSLVASAANYAGQDVLTASALGELILKAGRGLPDVASQTRFTMASMESQHKYTVKAGDNDGNAKVLADVAREAAEEGNLVASGGFCAPPEQLYNFFNIASRAGILNLPTVNAPRGSISLPVSPTFADFFGESGIATEWTNANDIDPTTPTTKPVYTFVCPEFQECEVSAWPTILQFGNFASRFYPEAIANATGLAMIAADRTLNAARIDFLRAAAVGSIVTPALDTTLGGGLINLTRNLSSNATLYRQTFAMDPEAVLEVVLPHWVPRALWGDAIARGSTVDYDDLRRRVASVFAQHDLRPSFVYDFDDVTVGTFPETTDALIYAPGTVVELDAGTLDLGVVRDSTLNSLNNYQTFVEPFVGWCQPGHDVILLNNVPICESGAVGAAVTVTC